MSEQIPSTPPPMPLGYAPPMATSQVRAVGLAQRRIMWVILGAILLTLSFVMGAGITAALAAVPPLVLLVGLALMRLALFALMMISVYQLAAALGYSMTSRVLCTIAMIIPLVGLIVLLVVNQSATNLLRRNGVHVGLMGARLRDLPTA